MRPYAQGRELIGIIHIGAEKTGTTTLQEFLHLNREQLSAGGVHYPRTPGLKQHSLLSFYAMNDTRDSLMARRLAADGAPDRTRWRREFRARLAGEFASVGADRLLVSSELLHPQLVSPEEVLRLKDLLDAWCDGYRIIFYMRRQDRAQVSLYSTALRCGGVPAHPLAMTKAAQRKYDYAGTLDLWGSVFGRDNLVPRVYEPAAFRGGDLIADFIHAAALPLDPATALKPEPRNAALSHEAQQFLLAYNRCHADAPLPEPAHTQLQRIVAAFVEQNIPGPRALPNRMDAIDFYAQFHDTNARVAREWFGRETLFEESFDDYPETSEAPSATESRQLAVAASLLRHVFRNAIWLDDNRLHRLLKTPMHRDLLRVLAGHVNGRDAELAKRLEQIEQRLAKRTRVTSSRR